MPRNIVKSLVFDVLAVVVAVTFTMEQRSVASAVVASDEAVLSFVKDIWPGPLGSNPSRLTRLSPSLDLVIMDADDGVHGRRPWITDGTHEGTHLMADFWPNNNTASIYVDDFIVFHDFVYIVLSYSSVDTESRRHTLWRCPLTRQGTDNTPAMAVAEQFWVYPQEGQQSPMEFVSPTSLVVWKDHLYFGFGWQLWKTDGTIESTQLVYNLQQEMQATGNEALFPFLTISGLAESALLLSPNADSIWKSDGTAGGTVMLNSETNLYKSFAMVLGDRLVFGNGSGELWATDGTPMGTVLLLSRTLRARAVFAVVDDRLIFYTDQGGGVAHLFSTDGTVAGTRPINFTYPEGFQYECDKTSWECNGDDLSIYYPDLSGYGHIATLPHRPRFGCQLEDGKILFTVHGVGSAYLGASLWVTDGTEKGTYMVFKFDRGDIDSTKSIGKNHLLLRKSGMPDLEDTIWISDGTANGTKLVVDITGATNQDIEDFDDSWAVVNTNTVLVSMSEPPTNNTAQKKGITMGTELYKISLPFDLDVQPSATSAATIEPTDGDTSASFRAHQASGLLQCIMTLLVWYHITVAFGGWAK